MPIVAASAHRARVPVGNPAKIIVVISARRPSRPCGISVGRSIQARMKNSALAFKSAKVLAIGGMASGM
jgi:hypothetical protein